MDLGLTGKTALVLGGGGGLGGAIARSLAREGVRVAVAGRSRNSLDVTVGRITEAGGEAVALEWDLGDLAAIDRQVGLIEQRFGPVGILVNNTGGPPPTTAAGQQSDVWEKHFRSMVVSVIAITDRVLPAMRQARWGRIITSASASVISPIPNLAISNALRLSLVGWSKTLSGEVGQDGITANVILPGRIATPRISYLDQQKAERDGSTPEAVERQSLASIPLGRYGDPDEYGDVVAFLASQRAAYITGSVIRVDGGLIASV